MLDDHTAEVTKLIIPQQVTGPLHFNVPLAERLRLVREVAACNEFILIQLHTHPREAFHSQADDRMAITKHLGAISVVIPSFGLNWDGNLHQTSIHTHLGASRWRKLSPTEVKGMFVIIP